MIEIPLIPDPIIHCDFDHVYSPSEDSFLILDYLKQKINYSYFDDILITKIGKILDLGTGTGIIAILLQKIKSYNPNFNPKIYASDISEEAIKCAKLNEKANNFNDEIVFLCSNLFESFPDNLKNTFNIIIFNPPYLPSSKLIKNKTMIDLSWNGGNKGYNLIIRFLKNALSYLNLKKEHYIYCVTSSKTNLKEFNKVIKNLGYKNEIVKNQHIFFEDIFLNRLKYVLD
ncbi:MAG: HemK2/MTQ2 family protein methyltransferase [Candidatus Thorarchaeota archaeon]